jgi:GR25 family glycosyltransferase involved in LPS biosynthesis
VSAQELSMHDGLAVFVINLNSSKSRLEKITRELHAKEVPFERIDAIDGRQLPDPAKFVSPFSRVFRPQPLFPREIGCWLSHKKVWEKITAEKIPLSLVLEDDASPRVSIEELASVDLNRCALDLLRVHVLKPDEELRRNRMIGTGIFIAGRELFLQTFPVFSATAYFLTLSGAQKMASRKTMLAPTDWFSLWSGFDGLRHGILLPSMFDADDGGVSTIEEHGGFPKTEIGRFARLVRRRGKLVKRYYLSYLDRRHARGLAGELASRSLSARLKKG